VTRERFPGSARPAQTRAGVCAAMALVVAFVACSPMTALGATTPTTSTKPAVATKSTTSKPAAKRSTKAGAHAAGAVAKPTGSPANLAQNARLLEELGSYGRAAENLSQLRRLVPRDADLDLALALDLARSGQPDSAATLLWGPVLSIALDDTGAVARRHPYAWEREPLWQNGRFDGWCWYVARARAEVALALGRGPEAHAAATAAVAAHPLAGKEWLLLALAAALDKADGESRLAAVRACELDPTLPEAQYLLGVHDWRLGQRNEAQAHFRAALALDSAWTAPALALVRSRLPGAAADTIPRAFLVSVRHGGELTSPVGPKLEEFHQMDSPALLIKRGQPQMPDSLRAHVKPIELNLPVLVDEKGRVVLHELPWFAVNQLPAPVLSALLATLPEWRFKPAMKLGQAQRVWAVVQFSYKP